MSLIAIFALAGTLAGEPSLTQEKLPRKVMVGYWHNFDNGSVRLPLRDVSRDWDLVQVAFAVPESGSTSKMAFEPYLGTPESFKAEVRKLQEQGQKVLISVGGANALVLLRTPAQRDEFTASMQAIILQYGFDGIDIDLEGASLVLDRDDGDFSRPTTPEAVHFIEAVRSILDHHGKKFLLTAAPETYYVQGGYVGYGRGSKIGAFLPFLHAFHDRIDRLHVQYYNSGSMRALDGQAYSQGSADFYVSQAELLLSGFPVGGEGGIRFRAFRPEQVVIGLPVKPKAWYSFLARGIPSIRTVQSALEALTTGKACAGCRYKPRAAYPALGGVMAWSINWDAKAGFEFSKMLRKYLDEAP